MKRTVSLILAALLLVSAVSCGGNQTPVPDPAETKASETSAPETAITETDIDETDIVGTEAPSYAYDTSLVTENGIAKAHIVLPQGASDIEKTGADELACHIKLVSGAEVSITDTIGADSLPIIIATPDSLPELEELFPEDLSWLREIGEIGDLERYGDDGFAIRLHEGKIYIFGANQYGALNGVYDFIEENLDVIWVLNDDAGIIYDEMPTISVIKTDYREKSPFQIRYSFGSSRNKHNTVQKPVGLYALHNMVELIIYSPIYDPEITEYWETNLNGVHLTLKETNQVNYWSDLTADTVAASVIASLDSYPEGERPLYFNVSLEDYHFNIGVYPEMNEPFEYAPGQFADPLDPAFMSTVYFTFINKIARQVAEKYPDVTINTLAYHFSNDVPLCDIEDNVSIWFCPTGEDYTQESFDVAIEDAKNGSKAEAAVQIQQFNAWVEKHPNIMLYTYYFTTHGAGYYERPLWYRVQQDFQYYAKTGLLGLNVEIFYEGSESLWGFYLPDGGIDPGPYPYTHKDGRLMNLMSIWLFQKLCWDPNEDVDALIEKFCDKVYGDASPYMQEYYDLLYTGWLDGSELLAEQFNAKGLWGWDAMYYYDYFLDTTVDDVYIYGAVKEALTKAWEAADDRAKEFIRRPYEVLELYDTFGY